MKPLKKELQHGQQCDHEDRILKDGKHVMVRCVVRHNDRSRGAPKRLTLFKGQALCQDHLPGQYRLPKQGGSQ